MTTAHLRSHGKLSDVHLLARNGLLKTLVHIAAERMGVVELLQRLHRERVRILMYHRFPRQHAQSFDRQCAFLAAKYKVVSLQEAAERLRAQQPLANLAVITVDDGYLDMHEVAFPILRKYQLPATLFVTTGFIDQTCWMPGDRVRYHFAHAADRRLEITDETGAAQVFQTDQAADADAFRALLKRVPECTKQRILTEMARVLPVPGQMPPEYQPCSWAQLRELAEHDVTIGAHTVTHPILSRLETSEATEREIVGSQRAIEEALQRPVKTFAYPNGLREDVNREGVACVRRHFDAAVTAVSGLNAPGSDVHALLRLPCDPHFPVSQLARLMAGPLGRSPAAKPLLEAAV